ncbi:MAG: cell division protein ZapA [Candidatus Aureabacteria bacterium]|nr:cell division protein ZapA [Candidatus Auribacterota bacterium]MCK5655980.1 cell division protein ZapA [Candidatus Auribacterota bacterium]
MSSEPVKVKIYGAEYPVIGDINEDHIVKVASVVDKKMIELAKESPGIPVAKLAILACLNFVDTLMKNDKKFKEAEEKVNRIITIVDSEMIS